MAFPLGSPHAAKCSYVAPFASTSARVDRTNDHLSIPVHLTNVGAGHRVPAGFSQERETWIELDVTDVRGARVYRVGHIDRADEDLRDKIFSRVTTRDDGGRDRQGRPLGVFGADVEDGPDAPRWIASGTDDAPVFRGSAWPICKTDFSAACAASASSTRAAFARPIDPVDKARHAPIALPMGITISTPARAART